MRVCKLVLMMLVFLPAFARPVVFRVSDPIHPGETALLFGDDIGQKVIVEGWRVPESGPAPNPQRLVVLQSSDVSAKVVIPKDWKDGVFALRLRNDTGESAVVYLNRTEPWWYLAGEGHTAFAGEEIRVFGKNFGSATTAWLKAGPAHIALAVRKAEPYTARFVVPAATAAGDYELWVWNGWGRDSYGGPLKVHVQKRAPQPSTKFNVKDFGAAGDGWQDDTDAIRSALARAVTAGGGVVFIPAGRYKITGKLVVPPHTILRGASRDTVRLVVPMKTPEFDAVLAGDRDFGVEDLSVVSQTAHRLVAAPDLPAVYSRTWGTNPPAGQEASNVHLRRLRLQHLYYAHRVNKGDPRRDVDVGPATVVMAGDDLELSDSEVISSGMPIAIHGAHRLRIERNRLDTGRNGWYGIWNSEDDVIEDNIIEGRDMEGSYGGFQNRSDHVYYAGNRLQDAYGDEREALTFDTPYIPHWMGRIGTATATTLTTHEYDGTEKHWKPGELKGEVCLIAYGKGLGEYIRIADNTEDAITLERPWDVEPDATSNVVIHSDRSQIVITHNHFSDASAAVQLYAQSYGIIVDGNQSERTGGFYGLSWDIWIEQRKARRYSTCWFNEWLNNDLKEGFTYDQGAWQDGVLGPETDARGGKLEPPAIMTMGNVVRNNKLNGRNTAGAFLAGPHPFALTSFGVLGYIGRDTIIEGNNVSDSPTAIDIYPGFRDTVVRHNQVERCPIPLSDDGMNTWVDSAERLRQQTRAAQERFGTIPTSGGLFDAVAKASGGPVEIAVATMLTGLHCERTKTGVRVRTEPWAMPLSVTAGGQTADLPPNIVVTLPPAEELSLVHGASILKIRLEGLNSDLRAGQ